MAIPRTRLDLMMLLIGLAMAVAPFLFVAIIDAEWWQEELRQDLGDFGKRIDMALAVVFFLGGGLATAALTRIFWRWSRR
jgi:hypothetical protein